MAVDVTLVLVGLAIFAIWVGWAVVRLRRTVEPDWPLSGPVGRMARRHLHSAHRRIRWASNRVRAVPALYREARGMGEGRILSVLAALLTARAQWAWCWRWGEGWPGDEGAADENTAEAVTTNGGARRGV